jgi:hypothetical protein
VDYGVDSEEGPGGDGVAMACDRRQRRALSNAQLRTLTSHGELMLFILYDETIVLLHLFSVPFEEGKCSHEA